MPGHEVRPRHEAIQCDVCALWQHRTCHTGVTRDEYRQAVRGDTPPPVPAPFLLLTSDPVY